MCALLFGCDQGEPDLAESTGPPLQVVATFPAPGAGVDCELGSPNDCGVPRNVALELRFNRHLDSSTAVRQSVRLYTGDPDLGVFLQPEYDLVERVVIYRLPDDVLLEPFGLYTVELVVPSEDNDFGFRAFDGAPLSEGPVPLSFDFRAETQDPPGSSAPPVETPPDCTEVLELFRTAGCSGTVCHTAEGSADCPPGYARVGSECIGVPRMGLRLGSGGDLRETAIGKVAHQTEIGSKTGITLENPSRVGVSMPIIDPLRPGNSYLMYKILRKVESYDDGGDSCSSRYNVGFGPGNDCVQPDASELSHLRNWFVRGEPMPLGDNKWRGDTQRQSMRQIQAWIRSGASLSGCQ